MKYIVIQVSCDNGRTLKVPFVFPDMIVHADMSHVMCAQLLKQVPNAISARPISAGELSSMDFNGTLGGHSSTLGVKSDKNDTTLLRMCDYGSMHA